MAGARGNNRGADRSCLPGSIEMVDFDNAKSHENPSILTKKLKMSFYVGLYYRVVRKTHGLSQRNQENSWTSLLA